MTFPGLQEGLGFLHAVTGLEIFNPGEYFLEEVTLPEPAPEDTDDNDENYAPLSQYRECSSCSDPNLSLTDERCISCRMLLPTRRQTDWVKNAKKANSKRKND